jgi:phosphatidylserine decarboxylase
VSAQKGKFIAAFNNDASNVNEQIVTVVEADSFNLKVKQIAGLIARRILCYATPNEMIKKGDRMGFIRFGSRADIVVPLNIKICVKVGQKVKAGESIIARINQ